MPPAAPRLPSPRVLLCDGFRGLNTQKSRQNIRENTHQNRACSRGVGGSSSPGTLYFPVGEEELLCAMVGSKQRSYFRLKEGGGRRGVLIVLIVISHLTIEHTPRAR